MKRPLRFWIILVTTFSMVVSLSSVLVTSYYVNRQTLSENALDENYSNAKKLSALTNDTFLLMEETLEAQHQNVLANWDNPKELKELTHILKKSNFNFNSVTIIDANGIGKANTPDLQLVGKTVNTEGARTGLRLKQNFTSKPYIGPNQKLMLVVSTALYKDGKYYGMLNGLVWLREKNFLTHLLEETYGNEKHDIAVSDATGTYIYHKNRELIGTKAYKNQAMIDLDNGKSGKSIIKDRTGKRLFAGYTEVPVNQWRIISMIPVSEALAPAQIMTIKAATIGLPFVLLGLLILIGLILFITKPLNRLSVLNYDKPINEVIQEVHGFDAPYREVADIQRMVLSFAENQQELLLDLENMTVTDPMTGLANRRRLNQLVKMIKENKEPFGYVLLDIDRFKQVNDTYGHLTGDQVLIRLAEVMRAVTPKAGLPIRIGGEEFAIILQETTPEEVFAFADELRKVIEQTNFPVPQKVTVSIGAGYLDCEFCELSIFYDEVDQQLYKAKENGRNRVETVLILKGEKHVS